MMSAEDLRTSILQYAIQGKLVPQDPNDEPASKLIERIRAQKQELIKQGEIKKDKNESIIIRRDGHWYEIIGGKESIIDDEIEYDVPPSWEILRLKEVGNWESGSTPSRHNASYYNNGTIPWLKTGELNNGYITSSEEMVTQKALDECHLVIHEPGSVLIAMYCGITIGKVSILSIPATTNQACCGCLPVPQVHNKYLFYYLMSQKKNLMKSGEGSAQSNISKEKIERTLMYLPPFEEQKRIVARIEELEKFIDQYARIENRISQINDEVLPSLRKSILQYAVEGKLVPQDPNDEPASELIEHIRVQKQELVKQGKIKKDKNESVIIHRDNHWYEIIDGKESCIDEEIPFDVPNNWIWSRLYNIGCLMRGSGIKREETVSDGKPCIRYGELYTTYRYKTFETKSFVPDELFDSCKKISTGEVILTLTGECKEDIGKTIAYLGYDDVAISGDLLMIKYHQLDPLYLSYMLNSPFICKCKAEMSSGDQIIHLSAKRMENLLVPIPPLAEQNRIVSTLEKILYMVDENGKKDVSDIKS